MIGSLRGRLLLGAALGVSIALVVSGVAVYLLTRASLHAQFDLALVAKAQAMATQVELDRGRIEAEIDPHGVPGTNDYFEIWARGARILRSINLGTTELTPANGVTPLTLLDGRPGRQITLRFLARPEGVVTGPLPECVLVLASATAGVDDTVGRVAEVLVGVGGFGTLLALIILALAIRVGLAPLRALAGSIAAIDIASLATRLDAAHVPAELRVVVARLNELLGRLGVAFERERELTAELAHELRTPLAGIRATIEVALDRERTTERYRGALGDVLAIARDTERIVEAMLSLARLDAGAARATRGPVDLDQVVGALVAAVAARCEARGVALKPRLAQVTIATDGDMLRLVVHNLLDNAVFYVDDGGTIEVVLTEDRLVIANSGCTLAAADAARVFERFWRGDAARATGTHAGLGLALCKKLVAEMGGAIGVEIGGGRFVVTLTWPRAA
jgi:two-component system, OmpR family, heavy metal sensor histidine kinase CusS